MGSLTALSPLFSDIEVPSHLTDDLPPIFDVRPKEPRHISPKQPIPAFVEAHGAVRVARSRMDQGSEQIRTQIGPKMPFKGEFNVKGLKVDSDGGRDKFAHESKSDYEDLKAPSSNNTSRVPSVDRGVSDLTTEMLKHFPDCNIKGNGVYLKNNNKQSTKAKELTKQSAKESGQTVAQQPTVESIQDGDDESAHERASHSTQKAVTQLVQEIAQAKAKGKVGYDKFGEVSTIGLGSVLSPLSTLISQVDVKSEDQNNASRHYSSNSTSTAKVPNHTNPQLTSNPRTALNPQATTNPYVTSYPQTSTNPNVTYPKETTKVPHPNTHNITSKHHNNIYVNDLTEQSLEDPDIFGPAATSYQFEDLSDYQDNQDQAIFDPVTRTFRFEADPTYVAAAKKDISARIPSWNFPNPKTFQGPDSGFMTHDHNEEKGFLENQIRLFQQVAEEERARSLKLIHDFGRMKSHAQASYKREQAKFVASSDAEIARLKAELQAAKSEAQESRTALDEISRIKTKPHHSKKMDEDYMSELAASRAEAFRFKSEAQQMKKEIEQYKEALIESEGEKMRLSNQGQSALEEMLEFRSAFKGAESQISNLKLEVQEATEELVEYEAALGETQAEVSQLENLVDLTTQELNEHKIILEESDAEKSRLQVETEASKKATQDYRRELNATRKQLEEVSVKARSQAAHLNQQACMMKDHLKLDSRMGSEDLEKKNKVLQTKLQKTTNALNRTKNAYLEMKQAHEEENVAKEKERETMKKALFQAWGSNEVGEVTMQKGGTMRRGTGYRYMYQ